MKKTEEELLLHISRLEAIVNNLPFQAWYKDSDGKYLIVNNKVEEELERPKEEIIGKNDYELYPKDTAEACIGTDRAAIEGENSGFYEFRIGNDVFEDYKQPVYNVSGELIGTTGLSQNITQRKKAAERLKSIEQNNSMLLTNMPGVAFRCNNDAEYTVTFISESCYDLTGYTAAELLAGKPSYNDLIHPEYRRALIGKWDSESDANVISTDEYPIRTKSGETKWVMEQSQRTYDADNKEIGAEGFITDVTSRKLAEQALKRSEERFRTMFEEAPLGMAIIDALTGEIYEINTKYAEILGRTKRQLISTDIKNFSYPEEIREFRHKIDLILKKQISSFSQYKRIIRTDGSDVWVNIIMAQLNFEEEFSSPRLLCMLEDVTDRKKAEEEILYLSYYDQLTGLYNRRYYAEELRRIDTARNLPITLVLGDVNGLKLTNDAFGHFAGDRLLKHIADTIKQQCRTDDIVARTGGDEFVLLLPQTGPDQAAKLVDRIRAAFTKESDYPVVCSVSFGWDTKKEPAEDINKIYTSAEDRMYRRKLTESAAMRNDTIKLILRTLSQKYKREEQHAKRISKLCAEIADAMGMSQESVNELRLAGYMHNIGYIGLREELIKKTGIYTEAEKIEMERHPEIGYQLLRSAGKYASVADYILYHHERPDRKGYPSKVGSDTIPIQSRIIAIADAFDAMTSESDYRRKMSVKEALSEIEKNSGTQFDQEIVEVFLRLAVKSGEPEGSSGTNCKVNQY